MTEFRLYPPSSDIGKNGLSYHDTVPQAIYCRFGKKKKLVGFRMYFLVIREKFEKNSNWE